ncbi:MAG TPA: hypothetical protein VE863_00700 [Pyrinomonadaceae bacterium]|jgi:hypothetical protein|nr:hypothetical protein [Pyrinomonadaceae bacterium]
MSSSTPLYQDLDTTFVNLWSLLRKLTKQGFVGRVHIESEDYSADVFLDGSSTPLVREIDRTANTETVEAGALHRVVLRTRDVPGKISFFAGTDESKSSLTAETSTTSRVEFNEAPRLDPARQAGPNSNAPPPPVSSAAIDEEIYATGSYDDWPAIVSLAGELIGAVERGINAVGGNFATLFHEVRVELADDYTFLDPFARALDYSAGVASLRDKVSVNVFVAGLSEALRRSIDRVATGDRERRVRERVALELLPMARKQMEVLERSGFRAQLDRIAGTRVM